MTVQEIYTEAEIERLGECCALVAVLGIRDAVLFDPERSALIYEHLPQEWLQAAALGRPEFDQWYSEQTGASYAPKGDA
jgi:hypothetical protein